MIWVRPKRLLPIDYRHRSGVQGFAAVLRFAVGLVVWPPFSLDVTGQRWLDSVEGQRPHD